MAQVTIEVYNSAGQLVSQSNTTGNMSMDLGKKGKGMYFVQFSSRDGSTVNRKIILK